MESHPLVYIRTDGNETIATGHLMRCLSVARALCHRNALPIFIVSDASSISLLQKMMTPEETARKVFPIIHLQTDYRDPEAEIPVMQRILSSHNVSFLLVDSYFATAAYLSRMAQICRVAYLDDLQAFDYPVDLVVNYDLNADVSFYKSARTVLAGSAYTPLRSQFSLHPYHVWEQVKDLFLSTGGTDPFGIAGGLARRLLVLPEFESACLHVLTGPMHVHRSELVRMAREDGRIRLHENVADMASLMAECDLAVSAGGTTLYELCAIGVPSVSYSMTDNQAPCTKDFDRAGLIPYAGDIRNNPDFLDCTVRMLLELARDYPRRKELSTRMRMAVDGAGADRIAEALTRTGN